MVVVGYCGYVWFVRSIALSIVDPCMESLFHFILLLTSHGPVILMYQIFLPAALLLGPLGAPFSWGPPNFMTPDRIFGGIGSAATPLLLFWGIKFKIDINVLPMPYSSVL